MSNTETVVLNGEMWRIAKLGRNLFEGYDLGYDCVERYNRNEARRYDIVDAKITKVDFSRALGYFVVTIRSKDDDKLIALRCRYAPLESKFDEDWNVDNVEIMRASFV